MPMSMDQKIAQALGPGPEASVTVTQTNDAELPSCFAVTDLAVSTLRAAAVELAALINAREVTLDRRLAALWFDMTLRPEGWELPSVWDAIAGAYRASDGWIRLHTNAPHHRDAALRVLDCPPEKKAVASAVARWSKTSLEEAIVAENGAQQPCTTFVNGPRIRKGGPWQVSLSSRGKKKQRMEHRSGLGSSKYLILRGSSPGLSQRDFLQVLARRCCASIHHGGVNLALNRSYFGQAAVRA